MSRQAGIDRCTLQLASSTLVHTHTHTRCRGTNHIHGVAVYTTKECGKVILDIPREREKEKEREREREREGERDHSMEIRL
jgi:hypothetical protein